MGIQKNCLTIWYPCSSTISIPENNLPLIAQRFPNRVAFQLFCHILVHHPSVWRRNKQCVQQYMPDVRISLIYRASTRLRNLFAFKNKIPPYLASGMIYKFTCNKCKSVYIGESIRHTKRRFAEHMGISALTGKPVRGQIRTAVKDHLIQCRAKAVYEDFEILGKDMIEKKRRIKESLFIHRDKPNINIQGSSIPLLLF